ncbi:MAG: hypothetical protein MJ211_09250 [Bacteroidales bacterium]|nr:hypothetical protein [Bacteroidales bacterium]
MKKILYLLIVIFIFEGCSNNQTSSILNPQPSVYYWQTIFNLDSLENQFIVDHNIKKMYLRYFDITIKKEFDKLLPNATIQFKSPIPKDIEIIPTIFITENCLHRNIDSISNLLVDRIIKISTVNHIDSIKEIQIDCDWTSKSQEKYFNFLSKIKDYALNKNIKLSVTIRLHQLSMTPPPCDYGVLMLYNTGNYRDRKCENPILSWHDVKPFLRYLKKYKLPMCVAFPNFKWQLLFKKGKYSNILYNEKLEDTLMYQQIDSLTYKVIRAKDIPMYMSNEAFNVYLNYGDTIFVRKAQYNEIMKVKSEFYKIKPQIFTQTIIYDLNSNNINNLYYKEYEKIYSSNVDIDNF